MKKVLSDIIRNAKLHSPNTFVAFLLLLVLPLIMVFLVQQRQDIRQRAQTAPAPVTINIVDFQFNPGTVTVPAGTRITWINRSTNGVPHTTSSDVTGTSNSWDSDILNPGNSFSRTFSTTGTFLYHCNVHGAAVMSGRIIVVPNTSQPTPTLLPTIPLTPRANPTVTPTPSVMSGTPTPIVGDPPFVCLGSCPTPTPTLTPTPIYNPTPTPTPQYGYATPTPTPVYNPPTPTSYINPATPTPCPAGYTTTASDNGTAVADNNGGGIAGFFNRIIEFILNLFFRIFQLLFGINLAPQPQPLPVPTPIVVPTAVIPTAFPTTTPYPTPTTYPAVSTYPIVTAYPYVSPSAIPYPTNNPYNTPTPTPYYPTATPAYPYATPTPVPCDPPATPTSYSPLTPTPTMSMPMPSSSVSPSNMISVADLKYVPGNEPLKEFNLVASVSGNNWTYNGTVPGPELRVKEGDHVRLNVLNNLPKDGDDLHNTTVHSHGIVLPSAEDGIPGITQNSIKPGETFSYDYVPDNPPGTYWYHSHQFGATQVPKGLFGALIIEPKNPTITYDRDYVIPYRNVDTPSTTHLDAKPGERVRLRFLDAREPDFTGAPIKTAIVGVPFKVISLDAVDLNQPDLIQDQLLTMDLSQRMDVEFTMPASGSALIVEKEGLQTTTIGDGALPTPGNLNTLPDFNFLAYGKPAPNPRMPKSTFDQTFTMTIGPDLSINGKFFPNVPDFVVKKGQLNKIKFVNNSAFWHPMHLHGQFYTVLSVNGVPVTGSPIIRDALIVPPGETAEIAVFAENPGMWMFHCHIYAHAGVGLMMMNTYEGVFTPYSIAPGSGNHPQ